MSTQLTISQLAEQAGVTIDTVKYYHKQGLITAEDRTEANYRLYGTSSIERIKFIKNAQQLGFSLKEIKELLELKANTSARLPNAKDYVNEKLKQLKDEISNLTSQKEKLQSFLIECPLNYDCKKPDQACYSEHPEARCAFFNYLLTNDIEPSSELVFCRHSYLFDVGQWTLEGNFQTNGKPPVGMTGTVDINHNNNLWHVKRILELKDKNHTCEVIEFYIPPAPNDDITQNFVADCSVFGDVKGSIAFAGEDIFKYYEMPDAKVYGHEFMKRIHSDLYDARGVLSDGKQSLTWWDYELVREVKEETDETDIVH